MEIEDKSNGTLEESQQLKKRRKLRKRLHQNYLQYENRLSTQDTSTDHEHKQ